MVTQRELRSDLLVLASQSPRRLELLQQIGLTPVCLPVDADETAQIDEPALELVARLATLKAQSCSTSEQYLSLESQYERSLIIGADTVIESEGNILGKPISEAHGVEMLLRLSGAQHNVHSGVCLYRSGHATPLCVTVSTEVRFAKISQSAAKAYWNTGEPSGKAGGYAIQGRGAQFVECLNGSYSNVVGLPLYETGQLLKTAGFNLL